MNIKETYPMNFLTSKLYPWYLKQSINIAYGSFMMPKIVLDTYINAFKVAYRG